MKFIEWCNLLSKQYVKFAESRRQKAYMNRKDQSGCKCMSNKSSMLPKKDEEHEEVNLSCVQLLQR